MAAQAVEDPAAGRAEALLSMARRTPRTSRPSRPPARSKSASSQTIRGLERRIAQLLAERDAERGRQGRRLAALRRACDRRLAALVSEIASLRHHQARTEALERLVAERDATLLRYAARLRELESAAGAASRAEAVDGVNRSL